MGHAQCDQADRRRDPWGWPCPSLAEAQTLHDQPGWSATGCGPLGAIPWSVGAGGGRRLAALEKGTPPIRRPLLAPCGVWPIMGAQGEAGAQYAQWRQDALAQLRATYPPAELAALEATQQARLVAEGTPACALRMGVRAAVDTVLAAQAGLPTFEVWRARQEAGQ